MNLTVGTSPIAVIDSTRVNAPLIISNATGMAVYLGPPNVTVGTGYLLAPGASLPIKSPVPLYAVASASAAGLNVLSTFGGNFGGGSAQGMFPQSAGGNTSPVQRWAVGNYYAAGTTVSHNGGLFLASAAHTATALGDEPGIVGLENEWLGYWVLLEWHSGIAAAPSIQAILRQHCGRRIVMPAGWVTGTISGSVAVLNAAANQNTYFQRVAASTAGVGRLNSFNAAATYPYAIFPGTAQVINWDMPWLLEWTAEVKTGAAVGGAVRFLIGKAGGAFAAGDETLTSKGLGIQWTGLGSSNQSCGIIGWDTALRTASTTGTQSATAGAPIGYQLLWLPGNGAYLYADTVLISTLDTTLPSGSSVSGDSCIQLICKNTAGNASVVEAGHGYPVLTHLNPTFATA
jgi:hypothetical protein